MYEHAWEMEKKPGIDMCTSVIFRLFRIQSRNDTQTIEIFIVLSSAFRSTFSICCLNNFWDRFQSVCGNLLLFRVYEHIWEMEKKPGASFRTLFGSSLALGTLSRRRVFFEALKYETERNGGRLSPFGFSTFTVGAAVNDIKSMEVLHLPSSSLVPAHIFPFYTSVDTSFINQPCNLHQPLQSLTLNSNIT